MKRYSDKDIIQELLANDSRLQKRVASFYRQVRKPVIAYLLEQGCRKKEAHLLLQDAMVALFHDLQSRPGHIPKNLQNHFIDLAQNLWLQQKDVEEKNHAYHRLNEEKALEKLFGHMEGGCTEILKTYYFENKDEEQIVRKFGEPRMEVRETQRWECLKKLKTLLQKDTDLLHELEAIAQLK